MGKQIWVIDGERVVSPGPAHKPKGCDCDLGDRKARETAAALRSCSRVGGGAGARSGWCLGPAPPVTPPARFIASG